MKTYLYTAGAVAAALAMGGAPIAALAEDAVGGAAATPTVTSVPVQVNVSDEAESDAITAKRALMASTSERMREAAQKRAEEARELMQERRAELASTTDRAGLTEQQREEFKQKAEQQREEFKQKAEQMREEAKQRFEEARESFKDQLELLREGTTTPARTLEQLKQMIENRRAEIQDGLASTSPARREAFEHASQVSVAVHALLASKDLLGGGIGQQVSEIAKQMNDAVATTTSAEAKIQSRGFFSKLLFGGDKEAASEISDQVAQNRDRLQELAGLLSDASTTPDVKAELEAQIKAVQDEQVRLQSVAQAQKKLWGLFSWRLF